MSITKTLEQKIRNNEQKKVNEWIRKVLMAQNPATVIHDFTTTISTSVNADRMMACFTKSVIKQKPELASLFEVK